MTRPLAVALVLLAAAFATRAEETDLLPLGDPERSLELAAASPGELYDARSGEVVSFEAMVEAMAGARVVLLGEEHTHLGQKLFQARILDALAARGVKLVLGMEFFERGDDEVLAKWVSGELAGDEFLLASGWYGRSGGNFGYSRPVLETARRHGIPVVGLNVPRTILRTVSMRGLDALDEAARAEVGEVDTGLSPEHRYLVGRYFGETVAMLPPGWFDRMYAAQCVWDVVMARSILAKLPEDATMVVVVGSGHVAYGLGIPLRLAAERRAAELPPLPVVTFCPVSAPVPVPGDEPSGHPMGPHGGGTGSPPARFVRSLADFVGAYEPLGGVEAWPTLGVQLADGDDGRPTVSRVWPDSVAEAVGVAAGDVVVGLDGEEPGDLARLRLALARLEWGVRTVLTVERGGERLDLPMLLFPDPLAVEREIAPGYTVEPCAAPDPTGAEPVTVLDPDAELRFRRVAREGEPARVEEWRGGVLETVFELDADGRVTRTLRRQE